MKVNKIKIRCSFDKQTEYQIEYVVKIKGFHSVYRLRRGQRGSWTKWHTVRSIELLLFRMGFTRKPDLLADFYVEAYFGRGVIKLNLEMMSYLIMNFKKDELSRYFYSRTNPFNSENNLWSLPASSMNTQKKYDWLKKLIKKFA